MDIGIQNNDVQFLNFSRPKIVPPVKGEGGELKDPRSKSMNSFNLSAISSQLPPNTGPPGTVAMNGNGNAANSNKNLGHVPCKFFKQGICQAGKSCPFSHNIDGSLAADKLPCKYFQKGNCKFGLKCALAHFLPDGTRVNSRSFLDHNNKKSSSGASGNSSVSNSVRNSFTAGSSLPSSAASSQPIDIGFGSVDLESRILKEPLSSGDRTLAPTAKFKTTSYQGKESFSTSNQFGTNSYGSALRNPQSSSSNVLNSSQYSTLRSPSNTVSMPKMNASPPQTSTIYGSPIWQSPPASYGSYRESLSTRYPKSQVSISPAYSYGHESSAVDDEEDSEVFEEDYVPGSLGDLILTPQELRRRDSRSQSGTLLVKPSLSSILNGTKYDEKTSDAKLEKSRDNKEPHNPLDDVFVME